MSTRPGSPFSARSGYNLNATQLLFPKRDWISAPGHEDHRRIILCFDGTGNQFSETNSNVLQFFKCLRKDDKKQIVYYQTGIGTYTHPWLVTKPVVDLSMKLDAAIAWNLENHVQDAYRFLMQNYKLGDKVSLFGFSRGAYTARVLAGFVQKIGLLPRENHAQIPFAWNIFKNSDSDVGLEKCVYYKISFCLSVQIDFLGLWDTVAALGVSGRELPFVIPTRNGGIRVTRHALALDERRAKFKPNFKLTLQNLDEDQEQNSGGASQNEDRDQVSKPAIQGSASEVWFAGCHCDVGGGSVHDKMRNSLARISLRWMIRECFLQETGITFDNDMLFSIGFKTIPGQAGSAKAGITIDHQEPSSRPTSLNQGDKRNFVLSFLRSLWDFISRFIQLAWTGGRWLLLLLFSPVYYVCFLIWHTKFVKSVTGHRCKYDDIEAQLHAVNADDEKPRTVSQEEEDTRDGLSPIYDQLSKVWLWWIFEVWPLVIRVQDSKNRRRDLETQVNWGKGREIYGDAWNKDENGQEYIAVHRSVFTRMKETKERYRPRAWFKVPGEGGREFHWEAEIKESTEKEELTKEGGWAHIHWVE